MACAVLSVVPCMGVPPFPLFWGGWLVGVTRVVRALSGLGCGGASWLACASGVVRLWGLCPVVAVSLWGLAVVTGCARVGRCRSLQSGASPLCWCVPWRLSWRPSLSPVLWPLPFPSHGVDGLLVVPLSCDVLLPVPRSRACPSPCFLASSPRAFPLPFPFLVPSCWGGGEVRGALMAHARGWEVWSHWLRVSGV